MNDVLDLCENGENGGRATTIEKGFQEGITW